jgi:hypothetical protein
MLIYLNRIFTGLLLHLRDRCIVGVDLDDIFGLFFGGLYLIATLFLPMFFYFDLLLESVDLDGLLIIVHLTV